MPRIILLYSLTIPHQFVIVFIYHTPDREMTMTTIQSLRKDFKAYGRSQLCYDVYCDRVNFHGFSNGDIYHNFFTTVRGVVIDPDRSGYSISIKDALRLGIPIDKPEYIIDCKDLRKKDRNLKSRSLTQ